jgi:hypothetical protein
MPLITNKKTSQTLFVLLMLANVRNEVAKRVTAGLTRSPIFISHCIKNSAMLVDKSGHLLCMINATVQILYLPNIFQHQIQAMGSCP